MKNWMVSLLLLLCCSQSFAIAEPLWKWKFFKGSKWTKIVSNSLLTENKDLLDSNPRDVVNFCPNFYNLDQRGRIKFWTQLISAMALRESHFQTGLQYVEHMVRDSHNNEVISRGMMQMSFESVQNPNYRCDIHVPQDLDDAEKNLRCAMGIMRSWMRSDQVITAGKKGNWKGIARYWAVLRTPNTLADIRSNIYNTSFCRKR